MADPVSNWLYRGAGPGTQAATKTLAQTTPWGQVGKQILGEGGFGIKGKPGGFGSVNVGFDPGYKGAGATGRLGYTASGLKSLTGATVPGNIGGGTPAGRLAFEKLLQSPFARGVGTVGRLATGPIGLGITAGMTGAQLGDWAYKNWEPATKFGDWAGGGIYDLLNPKETSIDPTSKNLFTQHGYEEDDEYDFSGIEGQTAMLNPFSLIGLLKSGTTGKGIAKHLLKNKIQKEFGKKVIRPRIIKKIREARGETFGGTGKFKNIATGTKDYGPYKKSTPAPKKKYTPPARPHGNGGGGGGGQKGSAPTGTAGRNPWGRADGGLINFYRYGGFI